MVSRLFLNLLEPKLRVNVVLRSISSFRSIGLPTNDVISSTNNIFYANGIYKHAVIYLRLIRYVGKEWLFHGWNSSRHFLLAIDVPNNGNGYKMWNWFVARIGLGRFYNIIIAHLVVVGGGGGQYVKKKCSLYLLITYFLAFLIQLNVYIRYIRSAQRGAEMAREIFEPIYCIACKTNTLFYAKKVLMDILVIIYLFNHIQNLWSIIILLEPFNQITFSGGNDNQCVLSFNCLMLQMF